MLAVVPWLCAEEGREGRKRKRRSRRKHISMGLDGQAG